VGGGARRATVELFLVSFLILFFELACIRWFGSIVIFLAFFTNVVLMACFLGVSVGCLTARRRFNFVNGFIPGVLLAVTLAYLLLWAYFRSESRLTIDVGGQESPQQIYFGADSRIPDPAGLVVPIEVIAGVFFALIALAFVGLGQVMGRRFEAIPNRLAAYTADILGSSCGIVAFALAAYWRLPSSVWFLMSLGLGLYFTTGHRWFQAAAALAVVILIAARVDQPKAPPADQAKNVWSPYNFISYNKRLGYIAVNSMAHQGMLKIGSGSAYMLPYLLNRDSGGLPFDDVLVIGAGSGNDVAAALVQGAKHVDAVEIDPVIFEAGYEDHPNQPYRDSRVSVHLDDGRSFVRKTERKYDLIVYALVDSPAVHSSYSSVRLESFLFTEEAFGDVKAKLKPGGVFALYNFYRQGWVVGRILALAERVFGTTPIVVSLPFQALITAENNQRGYITFLLVGAPGNQVVETIRSRLISDQSYWLNPQANYSNSSSGYGPAPPAVSTALGSTGAARPEPDFKKIGLAEVDVARIGPLPGDDWPFLYLRGPVIPALNLRGMAIVGILSLVILFALAPVRRVRPNGQMFFLGAGFMLLETKSVVHMALLFGATWMVNSIVFFAILTMILLANLYVMVAQPRRLVPYYALLLATLAVGSLVPMASFLALPGPSKVIFSCAIVFVPVFFAGVIFATAFRSSVEPDVDFGSNTGGIILGGLSENLSLALGFNHLLWVAIGYYALSALLRPRRS
jgi:SAM-dependent methyltransferase